MPITVKHGSSAAAAGLASESGYMRYLRALAELNDAKFALENQGRQAIEASRQQSSALQTQGRQGLLSSMTQSHANAARGRQAIAANRQASNAQQNQGYQSLLNNSLGAISASAAGRQSVEASRQGSIAMEDRTRQGMDAELQAAQARNLQGRQGLMGARQSFQNTQEQARSSLLQQQMAAFPRISTSSGGRSSPSYRSTPRSRTQLVPVGSGGTASPRIESIARGTPPPDVNTYSKSDLMKMELEKQLRRALQEKGQDQGERAFTAQQLKQIEELNKAEQLVHDEVSSGRMKPELGKEAIRQIRQRIDGIIPKWRKKKGPTIDERIASESRTDADGSTWTVDKQGILKHTPPTENKDRAFQFESRLKAVEKAEAMVDRSALATGIPTMTFEQAYRKSAKVLGIEIPDEVLALLLGADEMTGTKGPVTNIDKEIALNNLVTGAAEATGETITRGRNANNETAANSTLRNVVGGLAGVAGAAAQRFTDWIAQFPPYLSDIALLKTWNSFASKKDQMGLEEFRRKRRLQQNFRDMPDNAPQLPR